MYIRGCQAHLGGKQPPCIQQTDPCYTHAYTRSYWILCKSPTSHKAITEAHIQSSTLQNKIKNSLGAAPEHSKHGYAFLPSKGGEGFALKSPQPTPLLLWGTVISCPDTIAPKENPKIFLMSSCMSPRLECGHQVLSWNPVAKSTMFCM